MFQYSLSTDSSEMNWQKENEFQAKAQQRIQLKKEIQTLQTKRQLLGSQLQELFQKQKLEWEKLAQIRKEAFEIEKKLTNFIEKKGAQLAMKRQQSKKQFEKKLHNHEHKSKQKQQNQFCKALVFIRQETNLSNEYLAATKLIDKEEEQIAKAQEKNEKMIVEVRQHVQETEKQIAKLKQQINQKQTQFRNLTQQIIKLNEGYQFKVSTQRQIKKEQSWQDRIHYCLQAHKQTHQKMLQTLRNFEQSVRNIGQKFL